MNFIRGDTFSFKFLLKRKDELIPTKEDIKTLFITARKYPTKEAPIIFQKTLNDVEIDNEGYCHGKFNPEDTEDLIYGSYFFDVVITLKNGYRKTRLFKFDLERETTIHESGGNIGN